MTIARLRLKVKIIRQDQMGIRHCIYAMSPSWTRCCCSLCQMTDEVHNWIRDFFSSHSHCTKFAGEVPSLVDITASVIQRSSLCPASYTLLMPLICLLGKCEGSGQNKTGVIGYP